MEVVILSGAELAAVAAEAFGPYRGSVVRRRSRPVPQPPKPVRPAPGLTEATFELVARGLSVIPLSGKRPLGPWAEAQNRRASLAEVAEWTSRGCNVGIVTGAISGVVVLDIDGAEGEASVAKRPALPRTWEAATGRGRHLYFRHPGHHIGNRQGLARGLDLRGDGGYVVAPPSIHESGRTYEWAVAPHEAELAPLPDWLLS